jgi:hypothetical protein
MFDFLWDFLTDLRDDLFELFSWRRLVKSLWTPTVRPARRAAPYRPRIEGLSNPCRGFTEHPTTHYASIGVVQLE